MSQDPYRPEMRPPQGRPQPPAYGANVQSYPPAPGYQLYSVQWPAMAAPAPAMVDGFMLVQPRLKPIPSGPAIGSLVAGIGGILASFPGLISAAFSPWAGLTFLMLAGLLGGGAVILAVYSRRQVRAAGGGISGRGVGVTGLILGIIACGLAGLTGLISLFSI